MNILVDTCIWSLALRRSSPRDSSHVRELKELINEQRVVMVGPVRQEILSGIREQIQFKTLRDKLRSFIDFHITTEDYETAALFFNTCRQSGVQGSNTDFLLCALAVRHAIPIFSTDNDFITYRKLLPISLHQPRA